MANENNFKKKLFIFGSIVLLLLVVLLLVISGGRKESFENKYTKLRLEENFSKDLISVNSLLKKTIYKQNEITDIVLLYNKLSNYTVQFDSSKSKLLRKFNPIKVIVEIGTVYFDEFTEEFIRADLKNLSISFIEYISSINSEKYVPKRVHTGYKNSLNKKAHNLYKKYSWSKEDCLTVAKGHIRIGMNKDMVIASWGRPYDINKTTYSFGVHEQWVYGEYGSNYVYFEDGIVTTIQN